MKRLQSIAMYLPQFHRLPENDAWWGKGFTEWVAVRSAEKLFDGHNQVREPLDDNYYDLMQKETMQWQADLAQKYGIDGFCFYHYYFKDGRKILEKPAENLLKWKNIDMPFCFCWANQTWARSWSNIRAGNAWAARFETKGKNKDNVLLEQKYGSQETWINHFEYLYPFFCDDRYIKINNKPVFLIYKSEDISILGEMLTCWNNLISKRGYEGIFVIGVNSTEKSSILDAVLFQGPSAYIHPRIAGKKGSEKWVNGIRTYQYTDIWNNALEVDSIGDVKTYFGGFVDYDDTPRRGKMGFCMTEVSPQIFEKNIFDLAIKNIVAGNEFLFINAWNEWGEGNYLEPDKKNGYGYLEAVKRVMEKCNSSGFELQLEYNKIANRKRDSIKEEKEVVINELNKFRNYYKIFDRWLTLKEQGQKIEEFFIEKGYNKILIYGLAALGKHLYEELAGGQIEVIGALDRRQGLKYKELDVLSIEDEIPVCDVIVVTVTYEFDKILNSLSNKTDIPIVSLQDVLFY